MVKSLPVALQLYTVRDIAEKDYPGTLRKVKEIGYDYVELAGLYGYKPRQVRAWLDGAGLKAISAHVSIDEMKADPAAAADAYLTLGCEYIAVPFLGEGMRPGEANFDEVLKTIDSLGAGFASKGLALLYHNHDFEFITMPDGSFGLDYMYSRIPASHLKTQLDVCWVKVAGQDPAAYIRKYAGRAPVVHLKDFTGRKSANMYNLIIDDVTKEASGGEFMFRPVGHGVQDMPSVLAASLDAGAKYVVVEQDQSYEDTSLEAAAKSRAYLKSLGW